MKLTLQSQFVLRSKDVPDEFSNIHLVHYRFTIPPQVDNKFNRYYAPADLVDRRFCLTQMSALRILKPKKMS
jgi:hypothetical protein